MSHRADGRAYELFRALTAESLKRVGSADPAQREFDAADLAPAAGGPDQFDAAKRWIDQGKFELFAQARKAAIEDHFRSTGHSQALRVVRRSPRGKHRAVWYLEPYALANETEGFEAVERAPEPEAANSADFIQYDFTPPGMVRAAWYAQPLIGAGSFVTRSWRGLLWLGLFLFSITLLVLSALVGLSFAYVRRPLQTGDLASIATTAILGWVIWRTSVRPLLWLVEDRIALAEEGWVAWKEEPAQLELTTEGPKRKRLQLVRYSAVCPICAGTVELRYSQGPNRRRLIGCCSEVPHEHVFTFDRILRKGRRIGPRGGDDTA